MRSGLGHIQFNVRAENVGFYRDLFTFLGWSEIWFEDGAGYGAAGKNGESFWFMAGGNGSVNDYDGPGVNHVAIGVDEQGDVDAAGDYLTTGGTAMLFETPRHRPDFAESELDTYYQIMFETPDRFLLEIVYTGPKA
jgi:catechol 2,3-dioxygenase-like lactoylglutathione lyase family enzyme